MLWSRRGVGGGALKLVPQASVRVWVWELGAPPPPFVVTPLRGVSKAGCSPLSGCPPPGGCRGPLSMCFAHGCAGMGSSTVPVARIPCEGPLVSGAVPPPAARPQWVGSSGFAARVSRVRSVRAWEPSTGPIACALAGQRCVL